MTRDYVFLHGGNHGGWCWQRVIDVFHSTGEHQCLALDIPGCGKKRGKTANNIDLRGVAEELIEDVRRAGIKKAVLVGHSMAGVVLPYLAQLAPDLFTHVIYVSACVPRVGESIMQTMGTTVRGEDPAVVGYPCDPLDSDPLELMRSMFAPGLSTRDVEWLLRECPQDNWPMTLPVEVLTVESDQLSVPIAYIVTQQDPILPTYWQGCFAERASAKAIFPIDAAHEVFLSHPNELAELLENAVKTLST